jgi:hypothetical protein
MKETTSTDIERMNIAILVLGSILTILIMREFRYLFSFAVASAVMTLNFRLLKRIIEGVLLQDQMRKWELLIGLPLKFLTLMGIVVIIVVFGDVDTLFFLMGLSTVFLSVVINQVHLYISPAMKRRQKDGA